MIEDLQRLAEFCKREIAWEEDTGVTDYSLGMRKAYKLMLAELKEICASNQLKLAAALQACERHY
jgi:hypothetical protein